MIKGRENSRPPCFSGGVSFFTFVLDSLATRAFKASCLWLAKETFPPFTIFCRRVCGRSRIPAILHHIVDGEIQRLS